MAITLAELNQIQFERAFRGYRRGDVDEFIREVATSFELVFRERAGLTDRVEQLEADLARHVELEGLLRSTLISAERAVKDSRDRARKEADLIIHEAHTEARSMNLEARSDAEQLEAQRLRIASLLRSALTIVEAATADTSEEGGEPEDLQAALMPSRNVVRPSGMRERAG
jgi:cell division initiation protein